MELGGCGRSKVGIMGEVSRALGLWRTRLARRDMMSDSRGSKMGMVDHGAP